MWNESYFKITLFFFIILILMTFFKLYSLIRNIFTIKKTINNSSVYCSIIQINIDELARNFLDLILLILSILLFFYSEHIMELYSKSEYRPINYQTYYLFVHLGKPIFYAITLISSIITIIDSLLPTIVTDNCIKVNCSTEYNKNQVLFKIENDKILIYNIDTKDTILCIESWRKKKNDFLYILKIYYTEEKYYQEETGGNCHNSSLP